jgi:hypothetical protein
LHCGPARRVHVDAELGAPAEFDLGRATQDQAVERGAVELALGWSRVRYSNLGRIIAGG